MNSDFVGSRNATGGRPRRSGRSVLGLLCAVLSAGLVFSCSQNPATYRAGDAAGLRSYLQEQVSKSKTPDERIYWEQDLEESKANARDDKVAFRKVIDTLVANGNKYVDTPYGARSLIYAADLEQKHFRNADIAQALYRAGFDRFSQHLEWSEAEAYAVYAKMRLGESLAANGKGKEALSEWLDTFNQHPNQVFSLQLPSKIVGEYKQSMRPSEAYASSLRFMDDAVKLVTDPKSLGRIECERLMVVSDAYNERLVDSTVLEQEISKLLKKYPRGENPFVDASRAAYESTEQQLKAQSANRTANEKA